MNAAKLDNSRLGDAMTPREVPIEDIFVDNHNPRLREHREPRDGEEPVHESVQQDVIRTMYDGPFGMEEIEGSIRENGLLQMDTIVVRPYDGPVDTDRQRYVVHEGNRRVAAIKRIRDVYGPDTEIDEIADLLSTLETIPVLVVDQRKLANPDAELALLQGIRHFTGIKEWGPYQKASVIETMCDAGWDIEEIKEAFGGLSTRKVKKFRRTYSACQQLKTDDEWGDEWQPGHYSHLEEAVGKPAVREWLDWDDDAYEFQNDARRREFYSWFIGDEDGHTKIDGAIEMRNLGEIIEYDDGNKLLNKLRNRDDVTVESVYAEYQKEQEYLDAVDRDWEREFRNMRDLVNEVPAAYIREEMQEVEVDRLRETKEAIEGLLSDYEKLTE